MPQIIRGYDVLHVKIRRLFADVGGGHSDGTWALSFRGYLPDLLIVDEFGLRDLGAQQAEGLYELIYGRNQRASTAVVSNGTPQDWYPLFPQPRA